MMINTLKSEAREKGFSLGRAEGETIGEKRGLLTVAKNLLKNGMNIKDISKNTGLSIKDLEKY